MTYGEPCVPALLSYVRLGMECRAVCMPVFGLASSSLRPVTSHLGCVFFGLLTHSCIFWRSLCPLLPSAAISGDSVTVLPVWFPARGLRPSSCPASRGAGDADTHSDACLLFLKFLKSCFYLFEMRIYGRGEGAPEPAVCGSQRTAW